MAVEQAQPETGDLSSLRGERDALALRREIADLRAWERSSKEAGLRNVQESWYEPSDFVDMREYYGGEYFQPGWATSAGINTLADRAEGRNWPVFYTEQELAVLRGISRALFDINPVAKGALSKLANYVIGTGNKHAASGKRTINSDLAGQVQAVVDDFLEENKWTGFRDRETFKCKRRDGDVARSLWHTGNGHVQVRTVEPISITEPANKRGIEDWLGTANPSSWTFGVHTDEDDVETVHGYYVQWTSNSNNWDYLPGGNSPIIPPGGQDCWLAYQTCNTDANVKRGLPDAFCTSKNLELARKLLRNIGEGASVQSAIAFFREHAAGITGSKMQEFIRSRAYRSAQQSTESGSRTAYTERFDPGTIVDHGTGVQYKLSALGNNNAPVFLDVVLGLVASAGAVWSMPTYMLLDFGKGASYAADLVRESPFVRACEEKQQEHIQMELEMLWKAVWFAWRAGRFGGISWDELRREVKITISPPDVAVRDRDKEVDRRLKLMGAGIIAPTTVAAEEGYDYAQEIAKGANKAADVAQADPGGQPKAGGPDTPRATDVTRHPLMKGEGEVS